jgi:hypothetical protein
MSRTARPRRALPDAISLARLRGQVHVTHRSREALFHFSVIAAGIIVFVRVRYAAQILATVPETAAEFRGDISRLRAIVQGAAISRELWLRSRHGTWRFFRVTENGLVEIGRDGQVCPDTGDAAAGPVAG